MGIRFYDEAVTNIITKWIKDPNLRVLNPDESTRLFEMTYDITKDQPLTLPMIAISRGKTTEILNTNKQPLSFQGITALTSPLTRKFIKLAAIPIHLTYNLDIYCKSKAECDEYARNFIFNIINYPTGNVTVPYNNINFLHSFHLELGNQIVDNSDIKEHLIADQFTRYTLSFDITDAYLFSAPVKGSVEIIEIDLNTKDPVDGDIVESDIIWKKDTES